MSSKNNFEKDSDFFLNKEDDDDFFEDCMEEIEAAVLENSITYSQKSKSAFQVESNEIMRHMLAQLDDFEATHETKSTPNYFTKSEDILKESAFQESSQYGKYIAETAELMTVDQSDGQIVDTQRVKHTTMEIQEIGKTFERCIKEVSKLQQKREELVQEFLELEKPMEVEVQALRGKLGEAQKLFIQARLQKQNLYVETLLLKRRLFAAARDCAQSQMALDIQQKEVEHLNQEQVL